MKKSHRLAGLLVVALLLGVTVGATATVGAADDTGPLEEAIGVEDQSMSELASATIELVRAQAEKTRYKIEHSNVPVIGGAETDTASTELESVQTYYNNHSTEFGGWINERTTASTDHDVVELEFDLGGETERGYLVANVSDGNYTETEIVDYTSRSVDETVTLCGYAADSAPEELETFHSKFVGTSEDVDTAYVSRLAGRYNSNTATSFPIGGDETECDT